MLDYMGVWKRADGERAFEVLFDKFNQYLKDHNPMMNEGIIIDGSFV